MTLDATVELAWHKSTFSSNNGDCVESAAINGATLVRDTKARAHGHLTIDATSWNHLITTLKD
ncbi:DUF397 domain-containing protein [Streptomyces sp. SID3343]|uniref:DUF397 domain-containing protein n=1 Tax=Streptomyces sp. SID3343 TaxID=2690260 RepID=UPI00136BF7AE|nr:DUF397 domain-containing protein [Streptomyces sp. SID3343]MYW03193.1 DUF397 domain-containing protein [Streptomyces sp. SID3343]